jgi:hypothetical protein
MAISPNERNSLFGLWHQTFIADDGTFMVDKWILHASHASHHIISLYTCSKCEYDYYHDQPYKMTCSTGTFLVNQQCLSISTIL